MTHIHPATAWQTWPRADAPATPIEPGILLEQAEKYRGDNISLLDAPAVAARHGSLQNSHQAATSPELEADSATQPHKDRSAVTPRPTIALHTVGCSNSWGIPDQLRVNKTGSSPCWESGSVSAHALRTGPHVPTSPVTPMPSSLLTTTANSCLASRYRSTRTGSQQARSTSITSKAHGTANLHC